MDGWQAERGFGLPKLTLEWEVRCRHGCYNLYMQRDQGVKCRVGEVQEGRIRDGFSEKGPLGLGPEDRGEGKNIQAEDSAGACGSQKARKARPEE